MIIVRTHESEAALEAAVGGTVTTFESEDALETGVNAATSVDHVVAKGAKFTLVDSPTLANIIAIVAKGGKFTVTSGTP